MGHKYVTKPAFWLNRRQPVRIKYGNNGEIIDSSLDSESKATRIDARIQIYYLRRKVIDSEKKPIVPW